jgi:hypothetical protein
MQYCGYPVSSIVRDTIIVHQKLALGTDGKGKNKTEFWME